MDSGKKRSLFSGHYLPWSKFLKSNPPLGYEFGISRTYRANYPAGPRCAIKKANHYWGCLYHQNYFSMMLFTFSGTTVLLGLAALSLLTGLTIYCFRLLANRRAGGELPHKIIPSYTQPIHALAFCVAISASLLAINWTVPVTGTELPAYVVEELDIIDTKIPVTKTPPPPPPPPPPPLIEPIQDEIVEEAPVFESQDVTEQDLLPPPAPPAPSAEPTAAPLLRHFHPHHRPRTTRSIYLYSTCPPLGKNVWS